MQVIRSLFSGSAVKVETQCATNHGAEVNNPFPEKLTPGNYAVHLPDSSVIILKNEKEICTFINQQRALGFPLDVNPKWGWEINQEGILFVPDTRFDWQFVHEELALLHKTIESQEDELAQKLAGFGIKYSDLNLDALLHYTSKNTLPNLEKNPNFNNDIIMPQGEMLEFIIIKTRLIRELTAQYADEVALMHIKVNVEKLRLEPNIVYSEFINNKKQKPRDIGETNIERQFRENVSKSVTEKEKKYRQQQHLDLEEKLKTKGAEFRNSYGRFSLIKQAEEKSHAKQKSTQKIPLSLQQPSPFFKKQTKLANKPKKKQQEKTTHHSRTQAGDKKWEKTA